MIGILQIRLKYGGPMTSEERYLSAEETQELNQALNAKTYRAGSRVMNQTFHRLRLIVLIAMTTGMRVSEILALKWSDVLYRKELICLRSKLKRGKIRYVPMPPEQQLN